MKPHSFLRLQLALTWGAAAFAPTAQADTPSKAEDWYKPKNGFETKTMEASYTGGKTTYTFKIGFFGDKEVFDSGWVGEIPGDGIATAIETAVEAKFTAARNEEKIEALGENLQSVLGSSEITMNKTDPNGVTHSVKYQVANGSILNSIAQNGGLQLTDPTSSHNIADNITLQWNSNNTMSLRNWQTNPSSTLVLANVGGFLSYLPYIMGDCSCTQKWETVAKWVGSTAQNEATSLALPKSSLADYLKKEHGMVFFQNKSNPSGHIYNAYFEQEDNNNAIYANFLAPYNWVDDKTLTTSNGVYSLKVSPDCNISLTQALTDPSSVTAHSFLALEESGDLHYVPIGKGITGGAKPDGVSIITNETGLAIAGYANASTDTVLTRSTEGLEWKNLTTPDPIAVDGVSIVSNETGLAIAGYANASTDTVLTRSTEGLEWKNLTTPDPIAVDGVSIVSNETGLAIAGYANASTDTVLTRSTEGLEWKNLTTPDPIAVDGVSIVSNETGLAIAGYANAPIGAFLRKEETGVSWVSGSTNTCVILAGAGINVTDNGGGAVTISAEQISSSSPSTSVLSIDVITEVRYDTESHSFQQKKRTISFYGGLSDETEWEDVFTAVSHRSEHESGVTE